MPIKISVVIICKNAAPTIAKAIETSIALTEDVVVLDTGSTDGTIEKVRATGARLFQIKWQGYGNAKNQGIEAALNDWIFSLDADEYIDEQLIESLKRFEPPDEAAIGFVKRLSYLGNKPIRFGEWGGDIVTRLFSRNNAQWDTSPAHENLDVKKKGQSIRLNGIIHHFTAPDIKTQRGKLGKYAQLMADKYYQKGKKPYWYKIYLSPVFTFVQNYLFKAGFLDGKEGFEIARANAVYSFQKYNLLKKKGSSGNGIS